MLGIPPLYVIEIQVFVVLCAVVENTKLNNVNFSKVRESRLRRLE